MCFATGVDPTKLTAAISLLSRSLFTKSLSPLITFRTPSGKPASEKSSANL